MNDAQIDGTLGSVFVDESGYTGADLLNADQTMQAVAAVRLSEESARAITEEHFGTVRSPELKLSSLVKRRRYREPLIAAILALTQDHGAVGYVFCKRYALWLLLLDDCVEPVFHRAGMPFYDHGWNRSLASLLFFTTEHFWGVSLTNRILGAYQTAARSKSSESIQELVRAFRAINGRELAEFFLPAMNADQDVIDSIQHPGGTPDISYSMVMGLVSWLEQHASAPYRIVHDNSQAIGKCLDRLATIGRIEESREFRISDVTTMQFPLRFSQAALADSRNELRLQLADLLAGTVRLCAEMLRGIRPNDGLPDELLGRLPDESVIFNIPSTDFEDERAKLKGTEVGKAIDFLTRKFTDRGFGRRQG